LPPKTASGKYHWQVCPAIDLHLFVWGSLDKKAIK